MAAIFEVGFDSAAAASAAAYAMLQNTDAAGGRRLQVLEVGITTEAATLSSVGLIRASTLGTPSGSPLVPIPLDDLDTMVSKGNLVTTWSVAPSISGTPVYLRKFVASNVQGSGVIWTFPDDKPLVISPGGAVLLWNFGNGAGSALGAYFRVRE